MLFFSIFHEEMGALAAKMFGVTKEEAKATSFRVFKQFRLAVAVLNVVPYVTLKIMGEP